MNRNELISEIVQSFENGCNAQNISDPPSDKEWLIAFLRSALLRISNASFEAGEVEERTFPERESNEFDAGYAHAITVSKEKRREWCEDKS